MVKGEIDLHRQSLFVRNEAHSVDAARWVLDHLLWHFLWGFPRKHSNASCIYKPTCSTTTASSCHSYYHLHAGSLGRMKKQLVGRRSIRESVDSLCRDGASQCLSKSRITSPQMRWKLIYVPRVALWVLLWSARLIWFSKSYAKTAKRKSVQ